MKNVIKLLGIIAIMAIIGLVAISCDSSSGGTNDPCKDGHTFPAWTVPTCIAEGNSVRTCIICTQTDIRTTGFAALGHQGLTSRVEATCITSGSSESGTCTHAGCGEVVTGTVIPALRHQGLKPAKAATCTTDGNESESGPCTRPGCGEVITGTVIPALYPDLGHDFDWEMSGIKNCKRCNENPVIGDTGPAGGKIFYIATAGFTMTDDNSTAYYLETNPVHIDTYPSWSTATDLPHIDIPGTETAIGTGRKNTTLILGLDPTAPAALECRNYRVTGYTSYTDWFLPSLDELNQLYLRRADLGITSYNFWSSTQYEFDINFVRYQNLYDGFQYFYHKHYPMDVRAVRAF